MKTIFFLTTFSVVVCTLSIANAQNPFSHLIQASSSDATKLIQAYSEPLFKGFGTGLNSGWNNTAETNKLLHSDIRISVNFAQVPTSDQTFDVTRIGLSKNLVLDPSSKTNIAQTYGGTKNTSVATPLMDVKDNSGSTVATFSMPRGQLQYIPAPNIQATIGLIYHTDLTIRTLPTINLGGGAGSVKALGFGIKHDIIQDFASSTEEGDLFPFDLAVAVNYNRITYTNTLNVQPSQGSTPTSGSSTDFANQNLLGKFSGTTFQAIVSKKILFFTPFFALSYQNSNTTLGVFGNYPIPSSNNKYTTITDPVNINENTVSGIRADAGILLKLSVFRIYASVSAGQYLSGNIGFGVGY
jgi:hypothetical protein